MYRKGVSALIVNSNKEILLVNLISFEDRFFAIPGGGVEKGETLEDAVYREIQEELGITKDSLLYAGTCKESLIFMFRVPKTNADGSTYIGSERNFFGFRFIGSNDDIKLQESEVRAYKWVQFAKLGEYLLFDDQHADTLEKLMEVFPEFNS